MNKLKQVVSKISISLSSICLSIVVFLLIFLSNAMRGQHSHLTNMSNQALIPINTISANQFRSISSCILLLQVCLIVTIIALFINALFINAISTNESNEIFSLCSLLNAVIALSSILISRSIRLMMTSLEVNSHSSASITYALLTKAQWTQLSSELRSFAFSILFISLVLFIALIIIQFTRFDDNLDNEGSTEE